MIYTGLNRVGEIADVKAHGGADVAEVYGGINYQNPIFYSRKTLTGTSQLTFKGLGQPLKDYHIFGETIQDGTPSPDYPVDVQGVGEWDATVQQYKIPITIGNVTTPIYIGSDPLYRVGEYADEIRSDGTVVRKVIEQALMGYGDPGGWSSWGNSRWAYVPPRDVPKIVNDDSAISNYYRKGTENQQYFRWYNYIGQMIGFFKDTRFNTITEFRDYVKSLYDSGNPLKIYYILETPTTEQVTVPSLSTIVGDNTLTVDTTVDPSSVSVTGNIKPTGYGQLLDANDVDIQDSTGEPIYIQG